LPIDETLCGAGRRLWPWPWPWPWLDEVGEEPYMCVFRESFSLRSSSFSYRSRSISSDCSEFCSFWACSRFFRCSLRLRPTPSRQRPGRGKEEVRGTYGTLAGPRDYTTHGQHRPEREGGGGDGRRRGHLSLALFLVGGAVHGGSEGEVVMGPVDDGRGLGGLGGHDMRWWKALRDRQSFI
jgi:hypothetical protein